ncbi:hypothetical protein GCM10028796_40890 [Ramlibacter monticola]|uniref:Flagellar FliJ protein n=1 Tax=Ramlibacter monticola TaxID=1926872 RepID=A0A936Z1Z7_9BURK|nr:hypothetical protein [Ramlibacter monticola]MBL0393503.1 hypothetical protein [Ramlibacter monticola]
MNDLKAVPRVDLRAFRWHLEPLQRHLDGAVESARLELGALQRHLHLLDEAAQRRSAHQREQERRAARSAPDDLHARARAVRYLASLEEARLAAEASRVGLEQRVVAARAACAERQRQLESVEALRHAAQRQHAQQQLRREWSEADAAWLALMQRRRAAETRERTDAS